MMKTTMRKTLSVLLATLFLLTAFPLLAVYATEGTTGEVNWTLDENGVFTVSGIGAMEDYASAEDRPWHAGAAAIKTVVVQSGVTRVGNFAFAGCENLTAVSLSNGLIEIGQYALADDTSLTELTVPETVRLFGYGAATNSGLETVRILSRGLEFEQNTDWYEDAITLPESAVIHGYRGTDAQWYCDRNERTFVEITEGLLIDRDSGESDLLLSSVDSNYVEDLWGGDEAGEEEIRFDYSMTMDLQEIVRVYHTMVDESDYLDTDYDNDGRLNVEAYISIRNEQNYSYRFSGGAYYRFEDTDLKGEPIEDHGKWDTWSPEHIVTVSADGDKLTVDVNGTLAEMAALAAAENGLESFRVDEIFMYVSVNANTYYYNGRYVSSKTDTFIESAALSVTDAHLRWMDIPAAWGMTLNTELSVYDYPFVEGGYEPVSRQYLWEYHFSRMGDYDEELDRMWGDGWSEDGIFLEEHDGVLYGTVYGVYDAGSNSKLKLSDLIRINPDVERFVRSLVGVSPMGGGGQMGMRLDCQLICTYADGEVYTAYMAAADEMTHLVSPCMHACSVCGLCTETERNLPCNFDFMMYAPTHTCYCGEFSAHEIVYETLPEEQVAVENNTYAEVTVEVNQIVLSESTTSSFVEAVTAEIGAYQTAEIFNVDVYDDSGTPYVLNQWGGEEESLTITIPVGQENAQAVADGDAELYHISGNGQAQPVDTLPNVENGTLTFTSHQFSPFILVKKPEKDLYGREALKGLSNAGVLVYAYDQIAAGVEQLLEQIAVTDGEHAITVEELQTAMDAYRRDYTHHFWLGNSYSILSQGGEIVAIRPQYLMSGEDLTAAQEEFEAAAQEILLGITPSMDDYAKELYLHDALAKKAAYVDGTNAHNAYGALVEGQTVCEGYAEALQYLLQSAGIQSFIAIGASYNPTTGLGEAHAWNYVRIDGEYYHVDLTWNDQGEEIYHEYFNRSDAAILQDHALTATAYALPTCSSEAKFYFADKDEKISTYTVESVAGFLQENDGKVHLYIEGDASAFLSWYGANIASIAGELGMSGKITYGMSALRNEVVIRLAIVKDAPIQMAGATIRTDASVESQGLRFQVNLNALELPAGAVLQEIGMVMLPKNMLGDLTLTADPNAEYNGFKVAVVSLKAGDAEMDEVLSDGMLYVSLTDAVRNSRFAVEIVARAFVRYTLAGETVTVYSNNEGTDIQNGMATRSVKGVARSIAQQLIARSDEQYTAEITAEAVQAALTGNGQADVELLLAFARLNISLL